ncbi:glycosyl hydrolase family 43 protein [Auriculariales sp. MPI-PUGE-AT-0066]|nr:glycosyl hydrolase family 43 protein [Auriculariales sp. MPI-PUGE-AT-0066]
MMLALLAILPVLANAATISFSSTGNPILADGSYYSADPAPLVVNNTLYIWSGRDEAPVDTNNFIMNEWQLFTTTSASPSGGSWNLYANITRPHTVFSWAATGTAYAAQVVQAKSGKFYLYAPVTQSSTSSSDKFAIGVAVADSPTGPWTDAHPSGPIISQLVPSPGNSIQNIDPTVLVDDDGKIYIYEGTFGQLRGYQLSSDMVTISSSVTTVTSLTGYFEAPWIMKRNGVYYLIYAANNAYAGSPCTPTSYHACQAYGTASSPLGPWTFRGVILDIVSSTTSHSGVVQYNGNWYMVYHTADATNGGHFRRSIAFDQLQWDDTQSPPAIKKIVQTKRTGTTPAATRNIAPKAVASSVNTTPIQYWTASMNDGKVPNNPLPPDYWCSYNANLSPQTNTVVLTWSSSVALNGTRMIFFADQPAGSNIGVPPPASWRLEYLTSSGSWANITASTSYPVAVTNNPAEVKFTQITTTSIRAILIASGSGGQYGGVGIKEWEALAPTAQ